MSEGHGTGADDRFGRGAHRASITRTGCGSTTPEAGANSWVSLAGGRAVRAVRQAGSRGFAESGDMVALEPRRAGAAHAVRRSVLRMAEKALDTRGSQTSLIEEDLQIVHDVLVPPAAISAMKWRPGPPFEKPALVHHSGRHFTSVHLC
ncbi:MULTISPECIES: hypothetical protein [Streptomyces]|uniref:Uncharacterized protein n=1 Tax=Streptomyces ramulosus TaxID=47762 RepID=A0ABW1FBQ1_9ACTN